MRHISRGTYKTPKKRVLQRIPVVNRENRFPFDSRACFSLGVSGLGSEREMRSCGFLERLRAIPGGASGCIYRASGGILPLFSPYFHAFGPVFAPVFRSIFVVNPCAYLYYPARKEGGLCLSKPCFQLFSIEKSMPCCTPVTAGGSPGQQEPTRANNSTSLIYVYLYLSIYTGSILSLTFTGDRAIFISACAA